MHHAFSPLLREDILIRLLPAHTTHRLSENNDKIRCCSRQRISVNNIFFSMTIIFPCTDMSRKNFPFALMSHLLAQDYVLNACTTFHMENTRIFLISSFIASLTVSHIASPTQKVNYYLFKRSYDTPYLNLIFLIEE